MKFQKVLAPILAMALFTTPALAEATKGHGKQVTSNTETVRSAGETAKKCSHMKQDMAARPAAHQGDATGRQDERADTNEHLHSQK